MELSFFAPSKSHAILQIVFQLHLVQIDLIRNHYSVIVGNTPLLPPDPVAERTPERMLPEYQGRRTLSLSGLVSVGMHIDAPCRNVF